MIASDAFDHGFATSVERSAARADGHQFRHHIDARPTAGSAIRRQDARTARPRLAACVFGVAVSAGLAAAQGSVALGGFSTARGGELALESSEVLDDLRGAILGRFPEATFVGTDELSPHFFGQIDIVLLSSVYNIAGGGIEPLSPDEQTALRQFVEDGGTALLFADNSDFVSGNQSLVEPFGLTVQGLYSGSRDALVVDPHAHAVTREPFGVVESLRVAIYGTLVDLGSEADPLAVVNRNGQNSTVAAIVAPGRLGDDSGWALVFSDTSMLFDSIRVSDTTELVLNAVYEATPPCRADLTEDGIVDTRDFLLYLGAWAQRDPLADWNEDGAVDTQDFIAYLNDWAAGC